MGPEDAIDSGTSPHRRGKYRFEAILQHHLPDVSFGMRFITSVSITICFSSTCYSFYVTKLDGVVSAHTCMLRCYSFSGLNWIQFSTRERDHFLLAISSSVTLQRMLIFFGLLLRCAPLSIKRKTWRRTVVWIVYPMSSALIPAIFLVN